MPFFDIFSKNEKTKNNQKQTTKIIIDNREKNSLIPSILSKLNINYEFANLPVADYIINDVAIERKTISDLKSSIINKRILFQLKEIKQFKKYLLIIELNQNPYEGIIHENALRGFILSTLLKTKIPIVFSQNEEDSAKYLSILASKTKKSHPSLRQKIHLSTEQQKQYILEGFPGIGPTTAKKLLSSFKSIKNIINAKDEEIQKILGKKTKYFKKIIN
ncbi:MAG: helix-hairpin-helix domain-containing protein [Candidatus Pacearchaeota archaeon]|nr:helix-hairpin-helix domain-containing protein [Candidatus Pacearchaeota archaeon]